MKNIKTIAVCNNTAEFDAKVNAALEDGWQIIRRYAVRLGPAAPGIGTADGQPVGVYYAELEKEEQGTRTRLEGRKKTNG